MRAIAGRHLGTLLLAVTCAQLAPLHEACAAARAQQTDTAAPRDRREAARQNAEKRLREAMVPAPMTRERFAAFLAAVDPALAADADLASAYTAYADEARAAIDAIASRITERLPAAYSFDAAREEFVTRPNPELVQVLALRDKATARILAAERNLLRAVALATAAERKIRFVEERLAWLDDRTPREGLLPSTRLTLLEILARAGVPRESILAAEPVLISHADKLATLREKRNTALRDGDARRAEIETQAGTLWRLGPADSARATEALLVKVDDDEFATEVAIRELHFDTLAKLRGRLSTKEGRRVIEEWQRSVHPELFDDERLLAQLIEASIALPSSTPDTDAAILDAVETAYRRLEPLAREASSAADLVLPRLLDRSDEAVLAEIAARQSVIAVQSKRRAAIRDLVTRVRTIAAATDDKVLAQFTGMAETLAALDRADGFDRASLDALAAAIAARAAEAETPSAEPTPASPTPAPASPTPTPASPTPTPKAASPSSGGPSTQPTPPASRPSGGAENGQNSGNRSGRGTRRQQGGSGGGE